MNLKLADIKVFMHFYSLMHRCLYAIVGSAVILKSHRLLGLVVCRAVVEMHERSSEKDHFDGIVAFQIRPTEKPICFK